MSQEVENRSPSIQSLVRKMERHGYQFAQFELSCEDDCLPIGINSKKIGRIFE